MFIFCFGLSMYSYSQWLHLWSWLPCSMATLAKGSQARPYLTAACLVCVHILLSLILFINPPFPHRPCSPVHFNWYQRDQHLKRPMVPPRSLIPVFSTASRLWLTCNSRSRHLSLQVRTGLWAPWVAWCCEWIQCPPSSKEHLCENGQQILWLEIKQGSYAQSVCILNKLFSYDSWKLMVLKSN